MLHRAIAALLAGSIVLVVSAPLLHGRVVDDVRPVGTPTPSSAGAHERNRVTVLTANVTPAAPEELNGNETPPVAGAEACPPGMVLIEGEYCTRVRHRCRRWIDDRRLPFARCDEYSKARCVGRRVAMRFCIDAYEATEAGGQLPVNHQSFVSASRLCKARGKRICRESEWNFACEGEEMRPYPYGWKRRPVCNQDRDDLYEKNPRRRILKDHRAPVGARPDCKSPFGVYDLVGNLDEPTFRDGAEHAHPFRSSLKGGWWMAGRNRCRPATTAHDDYYQDIQIGARCCADAPGGPDPVSG